MEIISLNANANFHLRFSGVYEPHLYASDSFSLRIRIGGKDSSGNTISIIETMGVVYDGTCFD